MNDLVARRCHRHVVRCRKCDSIGTHQQRPAAQVDRLRPAVVERHLGVPEVRLVDYRTDSEVTSHGCARLRPHSQQTQVRNYLGRHATHRVSETPSRILLRNERCNDEIQARGSSRALVAHAEHVAHQSFGAVEHDPGDAVGGAGHEPYGAAERGTSGAPLTTVFAAGRGDHGVPLQALPRASCQSVSFSGGTANGASS